jgi:putative glutamine amidotransferase
MPRVLITCQDVAKAETYTEAVRSVGVEPVLVAADGNVPSLDGFAGLLLSGGGDIAPARYGQLPGPQTLPPDPARDTLELALLHGALERGLPVLAICRGLQLFNVAHGGTLHQDIEGHNVRPADVSAPAHSALLQPATRLAGIVGSADLPVNSRHHQGVAETGAGLIVSALSPDGVVEGLERPGRRFALAVQWHPEDQLCFARQLRLFEGFAAACGARGTVRA